MQYKSYQHIEKLGNTEVDGILNGTCYLTYKIDGTNGCIYLSNDGKELKFGSRKRELSILNDNANFVTIISSGKGNQNSTYESIFSYLKKHPNYIIYGEWLVPHTIKRYNLDAWKKFYIFDVFDKDTLSYINYDIWTNELKEYQGINIIPLIAKLDNPTMDDLKALLNDTGKYLLSSGLGEGIVIKNYDYVNKYGRRTWAKILTEDFLQTKKESRMKNFIEKEECPIEYNIILLLTEEHIQKEYHKLKEDKGDWSSKYIFELLNRVFNEFFKDNWELILKKFHMPIINFKMLRSLSDAKVKETLKLW
jgi:hypothetical protein